MYKKPSARLMFARKYNWLRGQMNYRSWDSALLGIKLPAKLEKQRQRLNKEHRKFQIMLNDDFGKVKAYNLTEDEY